MNLKFECHKLFSFLSLLRSHFHFRFRTMSKLHAAVMSNRPDLVRLLLSESQRNIHDVDVNGDQPAHIAARLNHVGCMIALIEYDARMGKKNYRGLTPLGEAQMNNHREIADLIKENYTTNVSEEHQWNEAIENATASWYDIWDEKTQKILWCRRGPTGVIETMDHPPPVDIERVIQARNSCEKMVVRRIHPKSLISMKQLEFDKRRQLEREKLKMMLRDRAKFVEDRCATKLQSYWRRIKARSRVEQIRREVVAIKRIQGRYAQESYMLPVVNLCFRY